MKGSTKMKKQLHEMLGVEADAFIQLRSMSGTQVSSVMRVGANILYCQCSGQPQPKTTKLALKGKQLIREYDHDTREFSDWRKLPNK